MLNDVVANDFFESTVTKRQMQGVADNEILYPLSFESWPPFAFHPCPMLSLFCEEVTVDVAARSQSAAYIQTHIRKLSLDGI
jgi:hypothetical protein